MLDPPGVFTYRDGVAVVQLAFFAVFLVSAVVLCWRHGFRRSEGWVTLLTFSLLRELAAAFQLASIHHPSTSVYGGALICQGIGLAPLTLLNIAIFVRLNKFMRVIHDKIYTVISLVAIAGIVTAIYGGTSSAEDPTLGTNTLLKVAIVCFVAAYVAFAGVFVVFVRRYRAIPRPERKLVLCFAACAPFMVVRFLYSILETFSPSLRPSFSTLTGNVSIFLFMSVLEEIAVAAIFTVVGLRLAPLPPELQTPSKPLCGGLRKKTKEPLS